MRLHVALPRAEGGQSPPFVIVGSVSVAGCRLGPMTDHPTAALSRASWRCTRAFAGLALAAAASAGCADLRPHQAETAPYLDRGSASISGVVTIDTGQGQITARVNTQVFLTPATTLSNQRLQEYVIEKNELPDERESQMVLLTRTDSQGGFRFVGLAPGEYNIASRVDWSPAGGSTVARADVAYARVRLSAGESVTVKVTRQVTQR